MNRALRAAFFAAFLSSGTAGAAGTLFHSAPLTPLKTDAAFAAIADDAATRTADIVLADASLVDPASATVHFALDIGGKVELDAERLTSYRNADGTVVWHGRLAGLTDAKAARLATDIADDPMNSVTLVRNGDKVTGNVRVQGQLYAVRPLHDGRHAIVEIDESKLPPDHDEAAYRHLFQQRATLPVTVPAEAKANSVIRVLVNYTTAVNNAVADVPGLINLAIAESNQGYANSAVAITLQLAGSGLVNYPESSSFSTNLNRYLGTSDGYMDSIHAQRNSVAADVAVLLTAPGESCGIAPLNASASSAFSVSARNCATGNYTFAHEIGHNLGAHHDPAAGTNTIYPYGHGYVTPSQQWRTIMAYSTSCGGCQRLNSWSNPNKTYNGLPMGTASKHDNARVLNQRAATVAAFR